MSEDARGIGKQIKIGAKIPFELHLAAKQIYSMQRTNIGSRVEMLIRADLKRTMKRDWFKELPEEEQAIFRFLVENFDSRKRNEDK